MKILNQKIGKQVISAMLLLFVGLQLFLPREPIESGCAFNNQEELSNGEDKSQHAFNFHEAPFLTAFFQVSLPVIGRICIATENNLRNIPDNYAAQIHLPPPNQKPIY